MTTRAGHFIAQHRWFCRYYVPAAVTVNLILTARMFW